MKIEDDPELLDAVLTHFNLNYFPRSIGNPRQKFVYTTEEVWSNFRKWHDKSSFISTCGYNDLVFEQGKKMPREVVYTTTFLDFDHDTKPENAFADAQRVSQFLTQHNMPHWVQFSGSKGYHVHIVHKPWKVRFHWSDGSAESLKQMIYQFQDHLRQSLGLNTMDEATMGDAKRLCRMPFTRHPKTGLYATPLDVSKLTEINHLDAARLARSNEVVLPTITGEPLLLPHAIEALGIVLQKPETQIRPVIEGSIGLNTTNAKRFLSSLDLRCPGVVNELKRRNPGHKARVYSAIHAKLLGYDIDVFDNVWMELSANIGYVDGGNHEHRRYQMSTILNNPAMEMFPTCTTLKANGCCIGEACPKFVDGSNYYEGRSIKRTWRRVSENGQDGKGETVSETTDE